MATATFKFDGKKALVTGAGRGIGRCIVKMLIQSGATTWALSKTQANLDSLATECPDIRTVCVDLADWAATKKAVEDIGPIDLLVNNAGVISMHSFLDVTPDDFDWHFSINIKATVNVSQIVARGMISRGTPGAIVNVSSDSSTRANDKMAVYCASKGALDQLTRVMALELGPHQIRVNSVNPSLVLTDMGRYWYSDPANAASYNPKTIPLGKFIEEEDVASAVMYLLSDSAKMVNGAFLMVDGGLTVA